jgi:tetratricopeptide (TPR) repeat protein
VLQSIGDVYQAISEFERVVELAPAMFGALKNLAALYERQGFRAKAVEMWTRALDHSPSDAVRQTIKAHIIGLL